MKDLLEKIACRGVPENTNLWPRISAGIDERKSFMKTLRAQPLMSVLIAVVALILLTGVVYAIGKVTGYIPGVGFVQTSSLRILTEPVTVETDGLAITISEIIADSDHTFVAYSVDGIVVPKMDRPTCGAIPSLQLPDGSTLNILGVDDGGPQGVQAGSTMRLEQSVTYSSIPADMNDITLTFPCILPEGTGPENWHISLHLSPAPKNYATPAVEIGATFVASNPTFVVLSTPTTDMRIFTPEASGTLPAMPTPANGSGLHLDKVIELPASYILVGNFTDAGDLPGALEINLDPHEDLPHIEDSAGNSIAFKVREDIQPENMLSGVRYWAYEIAKPVQGPLTITLDQVNIATFYTFEFQFDADADPQMGQKWELNLPVRLGKYEYVMDSVEAIENGYLFKYHSGTDVPKGTSLLFNLIGHTPEQDSSELRDGETMVTYSEKLTYASPLPTGQLTVMLTSMETAPLRGPWTLTWTPPGK